MASGRTKLHDISPILKGTGNGLTHAQTGEMLGRSGSHAHTILTRHRIELDLQGLSLAGLIAIEGRAGRLQKEDAAMPGQMFRLTCVRHERQTGVDPNLPQGMLLPDDQRGVINSIWLSPHDLRICHAILAGFNRIEICAQVGNLTTRGIRNIYTSLGFVSEEQFALHTATGALDLGDALPTPDLFTPQSEYEPPPKGYTVPVDRMAYAIGPQRQYAQLVMDGTRPHPTT